MFTVATSPETVNDWTQAWADTDDLDTCPDQPAQPAEVPITCPECLRPVDACQCEQDPYADTYPAGETL